MNTLIRAFAKYINKECTAKCFTCKYRKTRCDLFYDELSWEQVIARWRKRRENKRCGQSKH